MNKKFCPKCKGDDVKIRITVIGEPPEYACKKCNYIGTIFPELEKIKLIKK